MIVKAVKNRKRRDIKIDKIYAVLSMEKQADSGEYQIRIVDDFGGLSVYDMQDFEIFKDSKKDYHVQEYIFVYQMIAYPDFLERYYADEKIERQTLEKSIQKIYESDLTEEELVKLILSNNDRFLETANFLLAVSKKLKDDSSKKIAKYYLSHFDESQLLMPAICEVLQRFFNREVYNLFLAFLSSSELKDDFTKEKFISYFNTYY